MKTETFEWNNPLRVCFIFIAISFASWGVIAARVGSGLLYVTFFFALSETVACIALHSFKGSGSRWPIDVLSFFVLLLNLLVSFFLFLFVGLWMLNLYAAFAVGASTFIACYWIFWRIYKSVYSEELDPAVSNQKSERELIHD